MTLATSRIKINSNVVSSADHSVGCGPQRVVLLDGADTEQD